VVAAIVHLVLVEALGDARHDVLPAREGVDLGEYRGHAMVAPIGV
jgi:hypothetical protein